MGYTTHFEGSFEVTPALTPAHRAYLAAFAETRRMQRDPEQTATLPDPIREAAGLPVGPDGGYFVAGGGWLGQAETPDVRNGNRPPVGQPSLWCQWVPSEDGTEIGWDGGEKFYSYEEWLAYIIEHFLQPWGYTLSGSVEWQGEDSSDMGRVVVTENRMKVQQGRVVYE